MDVANENGYHYEMDPEAPDDSPPRAAVALQGASVQFGSRTLFDGLTLSIEPGQFVAILGPNGAGKSTLLKAILGRQALSTGSVLVDGRPPSHARREIGYVPQLHAIDRDLPLRGRDLVRFGLDGHRYGLALRPGRGRAAIDAALDSVGASGFADRPVGLLSGGEQQRLRIAQALLTDPSLLLCDEPLLGLDLAHQRGVTELLDTVRQERGTTVLFVTHEINPILPYVDLVLYLVDGRFAVGTPDEVLTSERLSALYATRVDVLHVGERLLIVGGEPDHGDGHHHDHAHVNNEAARP